MTGSAGRPYVRSPHVGLCFVRAALVYWLYVFPAVAREVRGWRRRARVIPDADLRAVALVVLRTKRSNLEGAAAFAAFTPRRHRATVIRAQVALQGIYDYVDALAEQAKDDPICNSHQLHQAVSRALEPTAPHTDYYAHQASRDDGRYLVALVDACRAALISLPSQLLIAAAAIRFARRVISYQSFNMPVSQLGSDPLKTWAADETPACLDLHWWETAASAGSSLGIFALFAVAADSSATPRDVQAIEDAYFPWIGALHSLLDNLIDIEEDRHDGQRNFFAQYASPREAASRLRMLTKESIRRIGTMPNAVPHKLVFAGMVASYLSAREARLPGVQLATEHILNASGGLAAVALVILRARRALDRLTFSR